MLPENRYRLWQVQEQIFAYEVRRQTAVYWTCRKHKMSARNLKRRAIILRCMGYITGREDNHSMIHVYIYGMIITTNVSERMLITSRQIGSRELRIFLLHLISGSRSVYKWNVSIVTVIIVQEHNVTLYYTRQSIAKKASDAVPWSFLYLHTLTSQ